MKESERILDIMTKRKKAKQFYKSFRLGIFRFAIIILGKNKFSFRFEISSDNWD